jgi:UDP-glucuronate 4-epimerase
MQKNKFILVTGAAGFIGFHLSKKLLDQGFSVVGVDNFNDYYSVKLKLARADILNQYPNFIQKKLNISDMTELDKIFKQFNFSVVAHLAAQAGVRYSLTHPMVYEQSNLAAFLNILEAVRHNSVPRLVYASSSSVYGGNEKMPFSESDRVDDPVSLYAATKKANELMAHSYSHLFGFQTIGLRFFTVYGPWGRPDMAMWLFAKAILNSKPINVFNYGKMKRDFTYIDDIIKGVNAAMFNDNLDMYEIFNLGNHKSEQLLEMIELIENELNMKAEKNFMPLQPGDVPESYADINKAMEKLDFQPQTSINQGVPNFIKWFKEHKQFHHI